MLCTVQITYYNGIYHYVFMPRLVHVGCVIRLIIRSRVSRYDPYSINFSLYHFRHYINSPISTCIHFCYKKPLYKSWVMRLEWQVKATVPIVPLSQYSFWNELAVRPANVTNAQNRMNKMKVATWKTRKFRQQDGAVWRTTQGTATLQVW